MYWFQITATKLRDGLRFNHSSLKDAVTYLMHETSEAEVFLNTQGPERLQNVSVTLRGRRERRKSRLV